MGISDSIDIGGGIDLNDSGIGVPIAADGCALRHWKGGDGEEGCEESHGSHETDWGTNRYTALELIEETLNLKTPTVYDYVDKKPVVNAQSTEAAREKQERIKERFKEWVWQDDSRRTALPSLQ